ncbi:M23 family metallopeptidase [Sedimentibacter sp.]|uniref:M23 family metallopeptidase n=1 Tax=Sedimentibacter sp. TaxID=1960295 RepID=UPI0028989977|nr:M23 family metallopeptidase [Sedimentibacter sp.]
MKNRLKNARTKMKNFFIRLKHKDTSFFIIALCIVLLSTAIVWRYTSNSGKENNVADNGKEDDNIVVDFDPVGEDNKGIMERYESAKNKEEEREKKDSDNLNTMKLPLEGEVIREFTMDDLIYYEAIGEWRVHRGVDIKPGDTLMIESALAGTVESVNTSEIMGTEIVIDHGNNIKTVYSNLVTANVKVGEKIQQGHVIGNVGKTAGIESSDGAHLHFELLVDGKNVNPMDYIK